MVCVYDSVHRDAGWVILEYMWELYNIEHIALSICPTSKGSEILISSVPIFQGLLPPLPGVLKTISKHYQNNLHTQLHNSNLQTSNYHPPTALLVWCSEVMIDEISV